MAPRFLTEWSGVVGSVDGGRMPHDFKTSSVASLTRRSFQACFMHVCGSHQSQQAMGQLSTVFLPQLGRYSLITILISCSSMAHIRRMRSVAAGLHDRLYIRTYLRRMYRKG